MSLKIKDNMEISDKHPTTEDAVRIIENESINDPVGFEFIDIVVINSDNTKSLYVAYLEENDEQYDFIHIPIIDIEPKRVSDSYDDHVVIGLSATSWGGSVTEIPDSVKEKLKSVDSIKAL